MRAMTIVLAALVLAAPATPPDANLAQQLLLPNGLSVIVMRQPRHPVVAVQTWLQVGSVDEQPGQEGAARVLLQVLHDGGRRYGRDGVDTAVTAVGGRAQLRVGREHAVLSTTLPAEHLGLAVQIVADRLRTPQIDAARVQRAVAALQVADAAHDPLGPGRALDLLQALAFLTHPLRQPPRGWWHRTLADPVKSCRELFDAQVGPARAAIVIAGDVEPARALALVRAQLGGWNQRRAQPRRSNVELPAPGPRQLQVDLEGPGWLALGWRTPGLAHGEALALEVLTEALRDGRGALRPPLAAPALAEVRADWEVARLYGLLRLWAPLEPGQDPATQAEALRAVVEEKLRALDDPSLLAARARVHAERLRRREQVEALALDCGEAALLRGVELDPGPRLARLDALEPEALRAVAGRMLRASQRSAVWQLAAPPAVAGDRP